MQTIQFIAICPSRCSECDASKQCTVGKSNFPTTPSSTHAHISKALFLSFYVPPSCTSAEACVEVWPNAQLQEWNKCSVARNQTCLTMCVKCRCCATNRFSLNVLRQSACLQPSQSPPKRGVCIRAKEGNVGGNWWGLVPRYLSCSALYHCFSDG